MKDFKFYLDQWGVQDVIYNKRPGLNQLEKQIMEKALNEASAAFVQDFGKIGKFELKYTRQKIKGRGARYVSGTRPVYQIVAADASTAIVIRNHNKKNNDDWLGKFSKNAKF